MLFFVTIAVLLASANAKFYTDCGSKLATVDLVGVSGCAEDADVCVLKRNTNATISIDFTPSSDVSNITATADYTILGVPLPLFVPPQPDGCRDSGVSCPLKGGDKASYRSSLPILSNYPAINGEIIWRLLNQDIENLVCIVITVKFE